MYDGRNISQTSHLNLGNNTLEVQHCLIHEAKNQGEQLEPSICSGGLTRVDRSLAMENYAMKLTCYFPVHAY